MKYKEIFDLDEGWMEIQAEGQTVAKVDVDDMVRFLNDEYDDVELRVWVPATGDTIYYKKPCIQYLLNQYHKLMGYDDEDDFIE